RGLGKLDRADVVLGDGYARAAIVEEVGIGAAVLQDAGRLGCELAVDDAVLGNDAGQEHLGDDLDDRRAADAGDAQTLRILGKAFLIRPFFRADDAEAWLQRLRIDAHAFDRAGRRTLAGRDFRAFEGWAGRGGCRDDTLAVAENDLGV